MMLAELLAQAKQTGNYQDLVDAVPYARMLGLSARRVGEGEATELITTMTYAEHLIGNAQLPALHGGALGALLESAAIFELLCRAETVVVPKTITLTIDYLRSGAARDTHACGSITRHGRRVANVRVEAWQEDRTIPIATAHAIFLVKA